MLRGSNDLTDAMKRQNGQSEGEDAPSASTTTPEVEVTTVQQQQQQSPVAAQLTAQSPLQTFMVTGQVQQVQVQNVTLANPQDVAAARPGQPQQLLAHVAAAQGLRVPLASSSTNSGQSSGTAAAGRGGSGSGGSSVNTNTTTKPSTVSLPAFTLTPNAAAVLSQHGLTTQALNRLIAGSGGTSNTNATLPATNPAPAAVTSIPAATPHTHSGVGSTQSHHQVAATPTTTLQRHLTTSSAGMVVVPQLSPNTSFQQVVSHSPSASGPTLLLAQATHDAPATSTVSASGGTIHHHGRSPTRGIIPPLANPVQHQTPAAQQQQQQQIMANINLQQQLVVAAASASPTTPQQQASTPTTTLLNVTPGTPGGGNQSPGAAPQLQGGVRRVSISSLSPGVISPQRTSPLLTLSQLQRTSPIQSPERVRKRIKLEEVTPPSPEIGTHRKLICDEKIRQMKELKESYNEHLTELFFLQNGGNSMDYHAYKKRPTVQLLHFLKSGNLDSDEEEMPVGTETKINDEVKVITTSGGTMPLATPVAISTTLPPAITAMQQQGNLEPGKKLGGRHGMVFGHVQPTTVQQQQQQQTQARVSAAAAAISSPTTVSTTPQASYSLVAQTTTGNTTCSTTSTAATHQTKPMPVTPPVAVSTATTVTTTPTHTSQLAKVMAETPSPTPTLSAAMAAAAAGSTTTSSSAPVKSVLHSISSTPSTSATTSTASTPSCGTASGSIKTPTRPVISQQQQGNNKQGGRQHSISAVYDTAIGSQEAIVERAKQEAQVMQRVAELRKEGLWSSRRLPKVQEPPRNKAHWDYLLEEMQWLAADFAQERKWKKAGAKKIARMINKYFQEQQQKELRAEKEEANRTKRIAANMAKMIREFWTNIEKVVQYKQQSRLEEKRKKALDLHLSFIVDQTEKYSSWLTEGLQGAGNSSIASSSVPTSPRSMPDDGDFEPDRSESDDEETIAKAEEELRMDDSAQKEELSALERESTMPIDELINLLPKEILEKPASLDTSDESNSEVTSEKSSVKDDEYNASEDSDDDEDTIAKQEKRDKKEGHTKEELADLEAEGEMSMEELYAKYAGAYTEEFEAKLDSEKSTDEESDDSEVSESEDEEEDEDENEAEDEEEEEEVGLESLLNPQTEETMEVEQSAISKPQTPPKSTGDKSPGKDIQDIAATALSLQPTGYTLETTRVITPVPFLLKHSLREYQHVGLDWLATMHDRKLNGILADEMGLGKTIQTIALLAHLATEKGVWGPHLIVVPTSVMLNWEMELKKWCPAFKILTYYGTQKERKQKRTGWTKTNAFHVCITSYKLVIQDHQAFRRKKWKYFILDEAQNIKNFKSQRWQTLLNFSSQRRLLLTGTPLQNSLMELWSLMHFLMPHVFASHREFKEWFSNPLTGMVEGSREYNESLIKRLHKVLRPFLLRRLKADVEKQMPKKYEHVVMCRLSKRQRYLYDDFMAQAKTKETLASGHFMSVINILMQLRKVCNHPNLFDPRPVVSSFQQHGLTYTTASLVLRALEKHPLEHLSATHLHPNLANLELTLPAFAAHRIQKLQTPRSTIEEIDEQPDPSPRPKCLQKPLKLNLAQCQNALLQAQQAASSASPKAGSRPGSPVAAAGGSRASPSSLLKTNFASPTAQTTATSRTPPTRVVTPMQVTTPSATTTPTAVTTTQLVELPGHTPSSASLAQQRMQQQQQQQPQSTLAIVSGTGTNQQTLPITVQIHQTQQGTRLMIPSGQLSHLPPGFLQIVQTANGPQIIATQQPTQAGQPVQVAASASPQPVANGPTGSTMLSTAASPATLPASSPGSTLNHPQSAVTTVGGKPVVRVSPMAQSPTSAAGSTTTTSLVKPQLGAADPHHIVRHPPAALSAKTLEKLRQSNFFLEDLYRRQVIRRQDALIRLANTNRRSCEVRPVYGQDLFEAVNIYRDYNKHCDKTRWKSLGFLHCQDVHVPADERVADRLWRQTKSLRDVVHTPEEVIHSMKDILRRFVFSIPSVTAPYLQMHVSHPPPSFLTAQLRLQHTIHHQLSPKTTLLHPINTNMTIQCPEARLIQYDCGKLQTLDALLRRLKSEQHRVLIFTQMTKMLDVLEAFLNYHGHRYLRLDGTTHIEQRQILMDRFNMDRRIFCFILSTRSGGIGVNLTGADTVIFYDSDWNPTMDAQAQDRCHRIGQTRDVHIYRLISERTVEENILKKANQKRLLGDVAIEGGNFTTAFFKEKTINELFTEKENTIKELFAEPSGLHELADKKQALQQQQQQQQQQQRTPAAPRAVKKEKPEDQLNTSMTQEQIEQALSKAEDETDVQAAKVVAAEQKAELAEFDENIPWDEKEEAKQRDEEDCSKVEQELAMLEKELTSVERYAVAVMEGQMSPLQDELERAEEEVELAKEEWELTRLKALRQEEERRAELEEDEMLFTYSRHDAYNQVYVCDETGEQMPIWSPPTPPQDDNDVYIDQTICFLYEPNTMPESQLPQVYIKKEHKRIRVEAHPGRKPKVRKDDQPRVPRSLFDRPSAALRRDAKQLVRLKQQGMSRLFKPTMPQSASRPLMDPPEHPEWLIHEDWALLQAVQILLELPLNLMTQSPAHIANWDLVADVVNAQSRTYRSPKQCKNRYENVIVPREEGKILYDINPRKQKKSKGIYKTKNNRPMRTSQLFVQDNNGSITTLYTLRFDSSKAITAKRTPTLRPTLANPTLKNPKHAAVLAESGINYDTPMTPTQVATIRAERIAKEKKQAAAVSSSSSTATTTTPSVVNATTVFHHAASVVVAQNTAQAAQEQLSQQAVSTASAQATTTTTTTTTAAVDASSSTTAATAGSVAVVTAAAGQPQMTIVQGQPLTPVATTAVLQASSLPKATVTAVSLARSLGATGSIVVNTAGGVAGNPFATINKRVSQSVAGTAIQVATTLPRTLTQQTLTAAIANQQRVASAAGAAVTAAGTTTQVLTATTLTPGTVVAQRLGTVTATSVTPGTVQQALPTTTRPLTPQLLLKRATYLKQQQQLRAQGRSLPATIQKAEQLKQQQKRLHQAVQQQQQQAAQQQAAAAAGTTTVVSLQKAVNVTTPLITSASQAAAVTQARLQGTGQKMKRALTEADMAALLRRQHLQQQQQKVLGAAQQASASQQLAGTQIISGAQVVGQAASTTQSIATLVKTVSSPAGTSVPSVTIPVSAVPLNISVSVPQQKASSTAKVTQQQLRQIQQLQLPQRKVALQQSAQHKVPSLTASQVQQMTKAQLTGPLIIQGAAGQQQQVIKHPLNAQQLQQLMQQQKVATASQQAQAAAAAVQAGTIQQIITSVAPPTTVIFTQGQGQAIQTVAKVSPSMAIGGSTLVSQVARTSAPVAVTAIPASNTVTVVSHGVAGGPGAQTITPSSAVTLAQSPQTTLVKQVTDQLASPGKAGLSVTPATIAQIKAGRQVATSVTGQTIHVTQVPGTAVQQNKGPSMALQQVVQQVQAQAQQQAQQRQQAVAAAAAAQAGTVIASVPSATTMVQVTQQGQVVTTQQAATTAEQKAQQASSYSMRLRTQQKH